MDVKECVNSLHEQWLDSLPSSPRELWGDMTSFTVPHNWEQRPMSAWVAWAVLAVNVTTWWFYYYERAVIQRKHKKFIATRLTTVLLIHVLSGMVETLAGFVSVIHPQNPHYAHLTAYLALLLHIPSNLMLSPRVWGLRYITVTGYVVVGLLRAVTALRVLVDSHYLVADLARSKWPRWCALLCTS
mmetsp:Transcript_22562/g.42073  ORF Transcript_22562/g.42073 Transcript_22562/m.42073 type:complete len:186 (-) Transcript_22562:766-1323(-)